MMTCPDMKYSRIRKVTQSGEVTTVAGSGESKFADGIGTAASFNSPTGVAVDGYGNLFVTDSYNHRLRKITPSGEVTTVAGSGEASYRDSIDKKAAFHNPTGIAVDFEGRSVYVADYGNHCIRRVTFLAPLVQDHLCVLPEFALFPPGIIPLVAAYLEAAVVTTVAGRAGEARHVDGLGNNARFDGPNGVAVDNVNRCLFVADTYSNRIRRITFPVDTDAPPPPPLARLPSTRGMSTSIDASERCAQDEKHVAGLYCTVCDERFCGVCDLIVHRSGTKRANHQRVAFGQSRQCDNVCSNNATWRCIDCDECYCRDCDGIIHRAGRAVHSRRYLANTLRKSPSPVTYPMAPPTTSSSSPRAAMTSFSLT